MQPLPEYMSQMTLRKGCAKELNGNNDNRIAGNMEERGIVDCNSSHYKEN